jgi:hypothetical protein
MTSKSPNDVESVMSPDIEEFEICVTRNREASMWNPGWRPMYELKIPVVLSFEPLIFPRHFLNRITGDALPECLFL